MSLGQETLMSFKEALRQRAVCDAEILKVDPEYEIVANMYGENGVKLKTCFLLILNSLKKTKIIFRSFNMTQ